MSFLSKLLGPPVPGIEATAVQAKLNEKPKPLVLDVRAGCVEVDVIGHVIAGVEEVRHEDQFGAAPLVGREDVLEAEDLLHRLLEAREAGAAGVSLVTVHQRRPLEVAHRARAAVGQQVDEDVLAAQVEQVEVRGAERLLAFRAADQPDRRGGPGGSRPACRHGAPRSDGVFRAPGVHGLACIGLE